MTVSLERVLVVEDDMSVSRALARAVRSLGFDVATFGTGEELLRSPVSAGPAALLLDLHLPGLSGADLILVLRQHFPDLRIIVMTGRDIGGARDACLSAGAELYITKPISRADLGLVLGARPPGRERE
ncbi:response regulator [Salipiger bermudensis]|uniref:response regulator n=1 Tax=Salipiger bermudensis TaxID=344736 RepID=UPI00300BA290